MKIIKLSTAKNKLIILRGPSGSGKSTLSKELSEEYGIDPLSTDEYFMNDGEYEFVPQEIGKAHQWNQQRAKMLMEIGEPTVIIDNTNTKLWEMKPYVEMAQEYGYDVEFVEPSWSDKLKDDEGKWNVDFLEEMQQSDERKNMNKTIPRHVLEMMRDRYEYNADTDSVLKSKEPWLVSSNLNWYKLIKIARAYGYTSVVLDQSSQTILKNKLMELKPEIFELYQDLDASKWIVVLHHCTINLGDFDKSLNDEEIIGGQASLVVDSFAYNDMVCAFGVSSMISSVNNENINSMNDMPHITAAVNYDRGGKPFMSNELTNWEPIGAINLSGTVT